MSVIVDVVINTDQAEQQLQALQQQMADDLAAGAAQMGQAAGRAAGATARAAGKNATEEFLRAFDPDKLRAELQSAGLGEQEIEIILETTKAKAETQALKDSIATALSQASGLAEDQLKQITAQVAREVDRAAGKVKSVTEIVDGVRDLKGEIQGLGAAGDAAAEGIGQLVLNETVDKFGDLKDIFEKTGVALLGFSEQAVEAAVGAADIAEKGAAVGAAFGPMGAAIGLVAGGILGAFNESSRAAAEEAKKLNEEIATQSNVLAELQAKLTAAGTDVAKLTELQKENQEAQSKLLALEQQRSIAADKRAKELEREEYLQASLTEDVYEAEAAGGMLLAQSLRTSSARDELTLAEKNLAAATKLVVEQQAIADLTAKALAGSSIEAAKAQKKQFEEMLQGGKFAKDSLKSLELQYAELSTQINDNFNYIEQLKTSTQGYDYIAQAVTSTVADNTKKMQELAEIEAELESRKLKSSAATVSSTKATKEDTKAAEEAKKSAEALAKAEEVAAEVELARAQKIADYQHMLREQSMKDAAEQKKQREADAAQAIKDSEALAKATQEAAKANVEAYRQILSPYADFVGGLFTSFTEGMAAGQSATEAFAEATKKAIASALGSLAKELGVKSLASLAEGFAALSNPFTAAAAPGFFKASALYAAAAAAAGLGSSVLSTAGANSGASGLGAAGGGAAGTAAAGNTSTSLGRAAQETGTPAPIVIDLRGAMFPTTDLTAAQSFGEAVARSLAAASAGNQPMARRMFGSRGFVV